MDAGRKVRRLTCATAATVLITRQHESISHKDRCLGCYVNLTQHVTRLTIARVDPCVGVILPGVTCLLACLLRGRVTVVRATIEDTAIGSADISREGIASQRAGLIRAWISTLALARDMRPVQRIRIFNASDLLIIMAGYIMCDNICKDRNVSAAWFYWDAVRRQCPRRTVTTK